MKMNEQLDLNNEIAISSEDLIKQLRKEIIDLKYKNSYLQQQNKEMIGIMKSNFNVRSFDIDMELSTIRVLLIDFNNNVKKLEGILNLKLEEDLKKKS